MLAQEQLLEDLSARVRARVCRGHVRRGGSGAAQGLLYALEKSYFSPGDLGLSFLEPKGETGSPRGSQGRQGLF